MEMAVQEDRVVLTFDLDFTRILALQRRSRPSIILFRLSIYSPEKVLPVLADIIQRFGPQLEQGAIIVVDDDRIRIRALPIW